MRLYFWYLNNHSGRFVDIDLTLELEQLVHSKIRTGRYSSASEVVREALRLMQERDVRKEVIREKIAKGLLSRSMGRLVDGEAVFDRLESELDALEDQES